VRAWVAWLAVPLLAAVCLSCSDDTVPAPTNLDFDFTAGAQGWIAGFADYPVGAETQYELESGYLSLPDPLGPDSAPYISGNNHSDDLFMYYRVKANDLLPDTEYRITFAIEIATDVPNGCSGIGGSPGESVYLKGGASTMEPVPVDVGGTYRLSVDKGNQATGGANALVLGNVANSFPCAPSVPWELKSLGADTPLVVRTDASGSLWLFMGTDSGYEGTTSLYYTRFSATLVRE